MSLRIREPARVDLRRDIAAVDPRLREDAANDQMRRPPLSPGLVTQSARPALRRGSYAPAFMDK